MPQIQIYDLENVNAMINITVMLTKVNETAFDRGMIFVSVITVIYSVNFIYLIINVLFLNETI
jgi:5-carboxymethyl-2-hydroxymuconate isomerase